MDANLPRSTSGTIKRLGHDAVDVHDIGLGGADEIAAHAQANSLGIITRDNDFADIRNYPPQKYHGLVVLKLPDDAVADDIVHWIETFISRDELVSQLPGRLAIVSRGSVRFRPK